MSGDERTGVSIMQLTEGLDSGPVCAQTSEPIAADDTFGSLASRLEILGAELLVRVLDASPRCRPQDEALVTYAAKIESPDRLLDPARPAVELERTVRALTPHIGAHVILEDGERLGVRQARVLGDGGPPAGNLSLDGPRPVLGCVEGALELLVVQPAGRRPMSGEDYVRGRRR
jgi:methionyl-tRNA formyltransferase